jgi:hypothetical protein
MGWADFGLGDLVGLTSISLPVVICLFVDFSLCRFSITFSESCAA